jgi:predicted metal-binding protein
MRINDKQTHGTYNIRKTNLTSEYLNSWSVLSVLSQHSSTQLSLHHPPRINHVKTTKQEKIHEPRWEKSMKNNLLQARRQWSGLIINSFSEFLFLTCKLQNIQIKTQIHKWEQIQSVHCLCGVYKCAHLDSLSLLEKESVKGFVGSVFLYFLYRDLRDNKIIERFLWGYNLVSCRTCIATEEQDGGKMRSQTEELDRKLPSVMVVSFFFFFFYPDFIN